MKYIVFLLVGILFSCQSTEQSGHTHDEKGMHDSENTETPRIDYTIWTNELELFVEFPVLVVGQKSRFAAHFTKLEGHKPITSGRVTASLIKGDSGIRQTVESPSDPGIFNPVLLPTAAGVQKLIFDIDSEGISERIMVGEIPVFTSLEAAVEYSNENTEGESISISFLKEQAWKMEFQTEKVEKKEFYETISTSGVWRQEPNDSYTIVSTSNGNVSFGLHTLIPGMEISKGMNIATINSEGYTTNNIEAELVSAKAVFDQTKEEYDRKNELHESKVIPRSELEIAEREFRVAESRYKSIKSGYSPSGFIDGLKEVVSPVSGRLMKTHVNNGDFVKEGTPLFTVHSSNSRILKVLLPTEYVSKASKIQNILYQTEGGQWSDMKSNDGSVLSIDPISDIQKPNISVFVKVNEPVRNAIGSFSEVDVSFGHSNQSIAVPFSALLEEYGTFSVIVQNSGEGFEHRNVVTGRKSGDCVEIIKGLREGEVIVTKGVYKVKMASMSGQTPAHGHAH